MGLLTLTQIPCHHVLGNEIALKRFPWACDMEKQWLLIKFKKKIVGSRIAFNLMGGMIVM